MRTRSLLVAAVVALAGCSLSLKTDQLDPLKDAEGYCDTLFAEYVKKVDACQGATQYWVDQQYAQAKAMCANVAGMNITYDRVAAQQYIDAIRAADCGTFYQYMDDGAAALQGNVPSYGSCNGSIECADHRAYCVNTSGTCPGECRSPGVTGELCYNEYPDCAEGYYCDTSSGYPGVCQAQLGTGGDCSGSAWNACAPSYYCKYTPSGTSPWTCTRQIAIGSSCALDVNGCVSGSFCAFDYLCTAYQPLGAYCDLSGQYSCDTSVYPPAICDLGTSRCVGVGYIGQWCIDGMYCAEGYCDATGVCAPLLGLGAPCVVGASACEMGAYCAGAAKGMTGVCTTWPMHIGNRCGNINDEWAECFEGYCPGYDAGTYYCQPVMQLGDVCGPYTGQDPCRQSGFGEGAHCDDYTETCVESCN